MMLGKSHQRRASSISVSSSPAPQKPFPVDVEKYPDGEPNKRPRPRADVFGAVMTVFVYVLCLITAANLMLLRVNPAGDSFLASLARTFVLQNDPQSSSEVELIDMDAIGAGINADDELWKLDDHNRQGAPSVAVAPGQHEPAAMDPSPGLDRTAEEALATHAEQPETVNPQGDLLEMLAVSPIVILRSGSDTVEPATEELMLLSESKLEAQVLEILLGHLHISPEPQVVDLAKHPHHHEIVHYLQSYTLHAAESDDETETPEDIPRVFVGGQPVANHKQVVEMYHKKDLIDFLKQHGQGIINIE